MKRILSVFLVLCTVLSFSICTANAAYEERRGIVFVSPDGNDNGDGTIANPLATLPAARDKIREMKKSGMYDGYTVYLRGGSYSVTESLQLGQEDSGTEENPIVWRNYEDEVVTLTGGINITGQDFEKVTDSAILDRIVDTSAHSSIYRVDLKKYGVASSIDAFPFLNGAYSYNANVANNPDYPTKPDAPDMEILCNSMAMHVARYPNTKEIEIKKVIENGDISNKAKPCDGKPFTIGIDDPRLQYWSESLDDNILMTSYWYWDWADQTVPMAKIDVGQKSITSKWLSNYGVRLGSTFYVSNLIEELDYPGEYYIDRKNKYVYIVPPADMENAEFAILTLKDSLVNTNGASNITFRGIDVLGSRNYAFNIANGKNIAIIDSEISFATGIAVHIGGENCGIRDSYIHDVTGGVYIRGGDIGTLTKGNNYAINCHFERCARLVKTYRPGINVAGVGHKIMYCEFNDMPHETIHFAGQNHDIMFNEFYDVVNEAADMGAVYGGANWEGRGINIMYNYFHDLKTKSEAAEGLHAIYADDTLCGVNIVGNVFENIDGTSVWTNSGSNHNTVNNLFINNSGPAINYNDSKVGNKTTYTSYIIPARDLYWDRIKDSPQWHEQFPEYFEMFERTEENYFVPKDNIALNNVCLGSDIGTSITKALFDVSQNLIIAEDPGFVDMENRDYNLKPDSYLFEKLPGFIAVPFSRMGRYTERALKRSESAVLMSIGSPKSMVYGEKVKIDESDAVVPFIEDGRTYIPLRFLAESLGAEVGFDNGLITISSSTVNLELTLGSIEAKKNGEVYTLEKAPVVIDGRTLVPLRAVSELLDKKVFWHEAGFISISDDAELFDEVNGTDDEIISYLHEQIKRY